MGTEMTEQDLSDVLGELLKRKNSAEVGQRAEILKEIVATVSTALDLVHGLTSQQDIASRKQRGALIQSLDVLDHEAFDGCCRAFEKAGDEEKHELMEIRFELCHNAPDPEEYRARLIREQWKELGVEDLVYIDESDFGGLTKDEAIELYNRIRYRKVFDDQDEVRRQAHAYELRISRRFEELGICPEDLARPPSAHPG